jgi:hypothetical protein
MLKEIPNLNIDDIKNKENTIIINGYYNDYISPKDFSDILEGTGFRIN